MASKQLQEAEKAMEMLRSFPDIGSGVYQLQASWSGQEEAFGFISQLSRHSMAPYQAMGLLLSVSDSLRAHGCARTRIVAMPDGVHPKDYTIIFTSEA